MPFRFQSLSIPDVLLIEPRVFGDPRGFFLETYKRSEFAAHGIAAGFVQDNVSHSVRGVLRGLHYQKPPQAQAKLVMALRGEVFDVAVDIRPESGTFGHWVGVRMSANDFTQLYIPAGFAHGFSVTSDVAQVAYKCADYYDPDGERGLIWNDPDIGIAWPDVGEPLLSERDRRHPALRELFGRGPARAG